MEIGLDDGAVLGIDGKGECFTVRCLAGCLYLTGTKDTRDHVLAAGDQMCFAAKDEVVVEAWGDARVACIMPAKARPRQEHSWHLVAS